jgi:hypothetical protein
MQAGHGIHSYHIVPQKPSANWRQGLQGKGRFHGNNWIAFSLQALDWIPWQWANGQALHSKSSKQMAASAAIDTAKQRHLMSTLFVYIFTIFLVITENQPVCMC